MKSILSRLAATTTVAAAVPLMAMVSAPANAATVSTAAGPTMSRPLHCYAWVSNSRPKNHTDVSVMVATEAYARITTIAHFSGKNSMRTGKADRKGDATITYYINSAKPGYKVVVSVMATSGHRFGSCWTSFTPRR